MHVVTRPGRLPRLETRRLVLRDIALADVSPAYVAWLNDPETTKYLEIRFVPQTPERVREYVAARLADIESAKHFGIYDEGGTRLAGTVTLPRIDRRHGFAELSFVIGHPGARGRGYATEAVHAVCWYMFFVEGLAKIYGGFYDGHEGSARVFRNNGFAEEGRLRGKLVAYDGRRVDHVLMGILRDDFRPDPALLGGLPPTFSTRNEE